MAWWDEFSDTGSWNQGWDWTDPGMWADPSAWWENFDWSSLFPPTQDYATNEGLPFNWADPYLPPDSALPSADPFATQASDFSLPELGGWGMEPPTGWNPEPISDPFTALTEGWQAPDETATQPDWWTEPPTNSGGLAELLGTGTATPEALQQWGQGEREMLGSSPLAPTLAGRGEAAPDRFPSTQEMLLQALLAGQNRGQPSGILGSGVMGSDVLGAAGLLTKLLSGDPKMDPDQRALLQAQIERTKAEAEKLRQPPTGGGGGGGFAPPSPGGASNIAAFSKALGLPTGGLNTLYSQTQERLTSLIREKYDRQRAQVAEQANRMGTNPAGLMAQINKAEQEEMAGIVGQSQSALSPYLDVFARLFGISLPGSTPAYQRPQLATL